MKISIVIPIYNESAALDKLPDALWRVRKACPFDTELIFVDDGSTDGTERILPVIANDFRFQVLQSGRNEGRGASIAKGFAAADGDIVVLMDADLEHDPADMLDFIAAILEKDADFVIGNRYAHRNYRHLDGFWHHLGNFLLTGWNNLWTGYDFADASCGYRVFKREVLDAIECQERGFGIDWEILAKVSHRGLKICEVPIHYRSRSIAGGKKIRLRHGLQALWCIVKYNLRGR